MEIELLQLLEKNHGTDYIGISDFLLSKFPEEKSTDYKYIIDSLVKLVQKGLIKKDDFSSLHTLGEMISTNIGQPDNVNIVHGLSLHKTNPAFDLKFKITPEGREYLEEKKRKKLQDEFLERQTISIEKSNEQTILVSKSAIASNEATAILYGRTERYYKHQRNAAWLIVGFTAITMFVSVLSYVQTCRKPQQNILQLSQETRLLLDSTLKAIKENNSYRSTAAIDSIKK